jgi:hypothetical protein
VEGVKGLYPLLDIVIMLIVTCSGGSEGPVSTSKYSYYAPPLLPVVEGVKGLYPLLNIVTPALPFSFVVVEWRISLLWFSPVIFKKE